MKDISISHSSQYAFTGSRERHLIEGLCRWNYFPNQKASASELPPNITTRRMTPEVMQKLADLPLDEDRKKRGFDIAEFRSTRYNNVSRPLGLIHPKAYSSIISTIKKNHAGMLSAMEDANSAIAVGAHVDGRVLIMNYESQEAKVVRSSDEGFGKKFRVQTDIANCFGSVYTHSLEWAIRGFDEAKNALSSKSRQPQHWSSILDQSMRFAKRKETVGLPIGPATSSMAVEVILAAVDRELSGEFTFTRYVDDYTALCATYEEAQNFVLRLGRELAKYKMSINVAKTIIEALPISHQDGWISELMCGLSSNFNSGEISFLSTAEVFQFLDRAVRINEKTPDGSVLKFAVAALINRVKDSSAQNLFSYVINLAWHYPILLPYLEKIEINREHHDIEALSKKLRELVRVNSIHRRSDGICWALYYLSQLQVEPTDMVLQDVIKTGDCVALAMLAQHPSAHAVLVNYASEIVASGVYERDQNWLFLYELYRKGLIENPYSDTVFEIMKIYDVDFFCLPDEWSQAENYCAVCTNPFVESEEIPDFDSWWKARGNAIPGALS